MNISTTAAFTNRLEKERSPYLRQHSHNPVNWYPWGEEAFQEAKRKGLPIFLSIGYSTCHWCHVMERESFSDAHIARLMNDHFISIKVDREERPDVDEQYMTYVQMRTGSGGWPLSIFLTEDRKPFFGGTYFPPQDRDGIPGFPRILQLLSKEWQENRQAVIENSNKIVQLINTAISGLATTSSASFSIDVSSKQNLMQTTLSHLINTFDDKWKGFGQQPKFPTPVNLLFLLRLFQFLNIRREKGILPLSLESDCKKMLYETLDFMEKGGINDILVGGFHRYTTDRQWNIPHFEKMLYDQAQLLNVYAQANREIYGMTIEGTKKYLQDALRAPSGGYFCAEDADSLPSAEAQKQEEGAFATWTQAQLQAALEDEELRVFSSIFAGPVLHRIASDEEAIEKIGIEAKSFYKLLASAMEKLCKIRASRPRPHRDEKILTEWNALLILGFCRAGDLKQAQEIATFLMEKHWKEGRLYRTEGQEAFAGDYAFLINALLILHSYSLEAKWLEWAIELQKNFNQHHWDGDGVGGYFTAPKGSQDTIFRLKDWNDGAIPSINATAACNLLYFYSLTGLAEYQEKYNQLLQCFWMVSESGLTSEVSPTMMMAFMVDILGCPKVSCHPAADSRMIEQINNQIPFAIVGVEPNLPSPKHFQLCKGTMCLPLFEHKDDDKKLIEDLIKALNN